MVPKSRFIEYLLEINRTAMKDFKEWRFHPGMLFNSDIAWWGDEKQRLAPHEGIDLCCFSDTGGRVVYLSKAIKIPATFKGTIVKISSDFLGKSIFICHPIFSEDARTLYTIYGHTDPLDFLEAGKEVAEGEIIARIAAPAPKTSIRPHLHLSFAWIPAPPPLDQLNWKDMGQDASITLIDPLSVI